MRSARPGPDWDYILDTIDRFDPTDPAIQPALTGYLHSIYTPNTPRTPITDEWGAHITRWCMHAVDYAAFEPSTLTGADIWALHQGTLTHPDWFTPDQLAWINKRLPWAIVHAAIT